MHNRLLFLDTETGGRNPHKHSLLSIGVVVWDYEEGVLYTNEFYIRSDSYVVTVEAERINHFDEKEHRSKAIPAEQVIAELTEIKDTFFADFTAIPLAGHNVAFDVQFIKQLYSKCNRSYEKSFSHRTVDTYSIIKFLSDCQLLPNTVNSSASAFKHFGISVLGRHTALGDAIATMQLYEKLLSTIKEKKDNG